MLHKDMRSVRKRENEFHTCGELFLDHMFVRQCFDILNVISFLVNGMRGIRCYALPSQIIYILIFKYISQKNRNT